MAVAALGLAGCALDQRTSVPSTAERSAPTQTVTATAGPYDGDWSGDGVTSDGRAIHLSFSVTGGGLSAITYVFDGSDGKPCTNIAYNNLAPEGRPKISGQELKAPLGEDL